MSGVVKGVKKAFKAVAKVVKKIAPVALAVGSLVFTAGAALGAMPTWGAAISSLTSKMGATGILGQVLTGAVTQAGYGSLVGAATSALTGGNILKGAATGALGGAVTGGVMGGLGMQTDPFASWNDQPVGAAMNTPSIDDTMYGPDSPLVKAPGGDFAPVPPLPKPAPEMGGGGLGGWLERNQTLVGNVVSGLGGGLLKGLAAKDSGKAYSRALETKQALIDRNYSGAGRGLLTAENTAYLQNQPGRPSPTQRFDPSTYGGQYVFDPELGRIVFVRNQQA